MTRTKLIETRISLFVDNGKLVIEKKVEEVDAEVIIEWGFIGDVFVTSTSGLKKHFYVDSYAHTKVTGLFHRTDLQFSSKYEVVDLYPRENDLPLDCYEYSTILYAHPSINNDYIESQIKEVITEIVGKEEDCRSKLRQANSMLSLIEHCKDYQTKN